MAATPGIWILLENSVYFRGEIQTTIHGLTEVDVAAFDFDNTLTWSDSGLIYMRTSNDWVPTVSQEQLTTFFHSLIKEGWVLAIFNNSLENNPEHTQRTLGRIDNFISQIQMEVAEFNPFVFVSIRNDNYRKPHTDMWNLFLEMIAGRPRSSSFYCGDAFGREAKNPLYRWGDEDREFARRASLTYYTPDEILGEFDFPVKDHASFLENRPIIIMAAHSSQYSHYVDNLLQSDLRYILSTAKDARSNIEKGRIPIIVGERVAAQAGRRRLIPFLPRSPAPIILLFTRPIRPFLTKTLYDEVDRDIRGYANALDYHPQMEDDSSFKQEPPGTITEPFQIVRIN